MSINWKSVNALKFTPELYEHLYLYLRSDGSAYPPAMADDRRKRSAWRKKYGIFSLANGKDIVLRLEDVEDVWWAWRGNSSMRKQVLTPDLPIDLRLLNPTPGSSQGARDAKAAAVYDGPVREGKDGEDVREGKEVKEGKRADARSEEAKEPEGAPEAKAGLSDKEAVMRSMYADLSGNGYRGVDTFYEKIRKSYVGVSRRDVEEFLQRIELNQLDGSAMGLAGRALKRVMEPIVVDKPMQHLQMDLIDMSSDAKHNAYPFPEADAAEHGGVNYLLNIVDLHSKFLWSIPLPNKSAKLVASALQNLFLGYGAPKYLQSDNGPEFVNDLVTQVAARFGVTMRHSKPYNPQAQGQVERLNGTLKRIISSHQLATRSRKYIEQLPFLVYAYNTSIHSTTKVTPFQSLFKRDVGGRDAISSNMDRNVRDNLKRKAEEMIRNDLLKKGAVAGPLQVGDVVRVLLIALNDAKGRERRREMLNRLNKPKKMKFTVQHYTVSKVIPGPLRDGERDAPEKYEVAPASDGEVPGEPVPGRFYRHELELIDPEAIISRQSLIDAAHALPLGLGALVEEEQDVPLPEEEPPIVPDPLVEEDPLVDGEPPGPADMMDAHPVVQEVKAESKRRPRESKVPAPAPPKTPERVVRRSARMLGIRGQERSDRQLAFRLNDSSQSQSQSQEP